MPPITKSDVADDLVIGSKAGKSRDWNWHPDIPTPYSPLFSFPPHPIAVLKWFCRMWQPLSQQVMYVVLAFAVWAWLQPSFEMTTTLQAGWVFEIWLRNIVMMTTIAMGLHLWLYTWQKQGDTQKYDRRGLATNNRKFAFNNQFWDNVAFSLLSGVTVWTVYECGLWMAYANGVAPMTTFDQSPTWFVLAFLAVPVFQSFHFYWAHRLLHWPPLYRTVQCRAPSQRQCGALVRLFHASG